jgi:NadR type nicotinamide-nucleotide adenylyltransferase
MIKKIAIIGPESTGKSTLCTQLAAHYHTEWCPEFAREYLLKNGMHYSFADLEIIAKGQLALEDAAVEKVTSNWALHQDQRDDNHHSPLLFLDTDMYVMKVWCEYVFGKCHQYILDEIVSRQYDLYLLCNIDLPWVKDELREYPDEQPRQELYRMYQDILINQQVPWVAISGSYEERLASGVKAVDRLLLSELTASTP